MDLCKRLRTHDVLYNAWMQVRASGLQSDSEHTRTETRKFDAHWKTSLKRIGDQLRGDEFTFSGERGIAPKKGDGKKGRRPLVVAPVANRVVRRAILDVLQGYRTNDPNSRRRWNGIPEVRKIMETRTSIGGIARRGVPDGLALIDQAVADGKCYFVRTDIRDFFTRIRREEVIEFIRSSTRDDRFTQLFEEALATNLENRHELEERGHFKLFPDPEIGVAQGSALSALAGNIVLRDFDSLMNDRGIVCVRYIDDFVLLGSKLAHVFKAFDRARRELKLLGMEVYGLNDVEARKAGKADYGNIHRGTDILGYHISGRSMQPCDSARKKLLLKVDAILERSLHEILLVSQGETPAFEARYAQALAKVNRIVWGWSQAFKYTTARQVFLSLDKDIDERLDAFTNEISRLMSRGDWAARRRVLGVHVLSDTGRAQLPRLLLAAA